MNYQITQLLLYVLTIRLYFAAEIKTKLPKWTSIASDSSASILAATAAKSGIFLSKDGGISWEKVENVPQKSWYHITSTTAGDKLAAVAVGDSIYLSSDMGKTWMKSDAPEANWNNIVSSATGTYYFATAVADGIYRSADGGLHWESVYSDAAAWRALTVDAAGQYVAALEMEGSIYVSSDYGLTWQTFGPSPMAWLDITSSTTGQFLAATVLGEGIYVSDDFGQTWTASSAPKRSWQGLCSDSSGSTMVAITAGDGIYLSRDFGASWQQTSASTEKWSTINCDETGETLLVTSEGSSAMYKSIDGGLTWFSSTASMHEISKNKKLTLFAEMNMLFSSIDHKVSLDSITLEPTDYPSGAPSASPSFIPTLNPTSRPSCRPFSFPSSRPSNQPTARPSNVPSEVPSGRPSGYPSGLPSSKPSTGPSSWPSSVPSTIPSMKPSLKPSSQPSSFPSGEPSSQPSSTPTTVPTAQPTVQPSSQPSSAPSAQPTHPPTSIPTSQPSVVPSTQPTSLPSTIPSNQPTSQPSRQPSSQPSGKPSTQPTAQPSSMPSTQPTSQPSRQPSSQPTSQPSRQPTAQPSRQPSSQPSRQPIAFPTGQPSAQPTAAPIGKGQIKTSRPTRLPTSQPTSNPSSSPTSRPSFTLETDWANSLIALTANLTDPTYPTQITYNELVVNGNILQYGGCSSWATMLSGSLYYESLISKAASISVIVQNDLFSTSNPKASCKNATVAAKMVDFLLNPSSSGRSWTCGGEVWRAKLCDGSVSAPALCVGCSDPCDNARCLTQNPFFFGPCQSSQGQSCGNVLSSARALVLSYDDRATIPKIRSYNVSAAQGAIDLTVAIDAAGSINCGIFLTGSIPSSSADIFAQNVVGVAYPQAVTLKFSGLFPSSEYKIYCIATGDGGSQTSLQTALSAGISAKTSCCASAEITIGPNYVYVGQQVNSAVSVKVVASPAVTTTLALFSKFGSSNSLVSLFPQETTIQGSQTVSFSLISSNLPAAGIVSIIPLIVNGNGDNYTVVFSQGRNSMNVLNSSSATPPPTLLNATLSSDGTSALFSFDSSTDLGGITSSIFSCTTLFTSIDTTLRCSWLNDNTLKMYPVSFGSSLKPGLQVTLKANQIKAKCVISNCNQNQYMASTAVRVQKPAVPSAPIPILTLPSLISRCSDLSVDFSSSSGSGNQAWKSIGFSVSSDNATLASLIQRFLNQQGTQTGVITLPARFLVDGLLTISLKICSFLDACSQTSSNVVVTSNIVPTVSISGKQIQYYKVSDTLQITGSGFVQLCSGNMTRQNLVFSWSITPSGALSPLALSSTSKSSNIFALPASKLTANTWYQLQVSALYTVSKRSSFSSIKIFIQSGDIIPVVKGGSVRQVPVGKTLQLDASSSYDENTGTNKGLSFSWNCTQSAPVLSSVCPFTLPESAYVSILTILVPSTAEGRTAQVTATVTSSDNRKVTSSITVVAVSSKKLSVFLTTPVTTAINSLDKVQVSATISPANFTSFFWTCNDSSLSLVRSSLTAVNGSLQSPSASSLSLNLVLRQFSLTSGAGYMFGFTAQRGSVIVGSASIAIQVNGVPTPGVFTVSPTSGVELQQKFSMFAQYWSDPDLPLTYSFGFFGSSQFQLLQAASALALGSFSLPQGNSAQNYSLYTALLVFDKYQANSTVKQSIQVTANPSLTADALQNFLLSSFNSPSSDANSIAGTISTVGKILNSVNCSAAPSCSSLNRQECSNVANTCGTCLDGYIGAGGSGNSKCFASAASAVVTTNFALDSLAAAVTSCSSDSNCGSFQACVSNQCQYLQQSCPQDCSGHGSCLYVSLYTSTPTLLQSCVVTDITCAAQCRCNTGFYGADCSYTSQLLQTSQGNRLILLQQLSNLTSSTDLSLASLSSWISSLNSIVGGRSDELNPNTLALASTLMQDFLGYADDVDTTFETLNPLLTAVDQILYFTNNYTYQQSTSQEQAYYRAQAVSLISSFAQSVYQGSLVGQEDIIYDQDYFQLKFHTPSSLELGSGKNTTVQTSLSVLESYNKKQPYQLQINNIANVQSGLMLSFFVITQFNFGNSSSVSYLNNPVYYEIRNYQSVCGTSCAIAISLPNNLKQSYRNISKPVPSFTTSCYGVNASEAKLFTYQCPQNYQLKVKCNSTYLGTIRSTCPYTVDQPICQTLVGNNPSSNSALTCQAGKFSQLQTTCTCNTLPVSSRRLQISFDGSESNLLVGLGTTRQSNVTPLVVVYQPFQPTPLPTSAPIYIKSLDEKVRDAFSDYRYYWIGIGSPILAFLIFFPIYWYYDRKAKLALEMAWKSHVEVLRNSIWPLKEVNDSYRHQLDYSPLLFNPRLQNLLGENPFAKVEFKKPEEDYFREKDQRNDKLKYNPRTAKDDLEMLSYFKQVLFEENDQLRQFTNFTRVNEFMTASEREELDKKKLQLKDQVLTEEKVNVMLEKEVERRRRSLPTQLKNPTAMFSPFEDDVNEDFDENQPNDEHRISLEELHPISYSMDEIDEQKTPEPYLSPRKESLLSRISPLKSSKKAPVPDDSTGFENIYRRGEDEGFSLSNPMRYVSPKSKKYEIPVYDSRRLQEQFIDGVNFEYDLESNYLDEINPTATEIVRPLTPVTVRSEQAESVASQVPVNNPWNLLKSLSADSREEIRLHEFGGISHRPGTVFTFAEEIAKRVNRAESEGDGDDEDDRSHTRPKPFQRKRPTRISTSYDEEDDEDYEEAEQIPEEQVEEVASGRDTTSKEERGKGLLLQPQKSLARLDNDRMFGNHVPVELDYPLSPNLNYYIDPIGSNDVRRFSSSESGPPSRLSHHPSKKRFSPKNSFLNLESIESTPDYYLKNPSSYDTTKNLSPLPYRFAQSTASSQLKVKSRVAATSPHSVLSSASVRSGGTSLMSGVTRESQMQQPHRRMTMPEPRYTGNGGFVGNYSSEVDDNVSIMSNQRANYERKQPATYDPQYYQLPPEYPRTTDTMSPRAVPYAKELVSPDDPEFDVPSSFSGESRAPTFTKPQRQFLHEQHRMQMHEAQALLSPSDEEKGKMSVQRQRVYTSVASPPPQNSISFEDPEESVSVASRIRQFSKK